MIDTIIGLVYALILTVSVELFVVFLFKLKSNKIIVVSLVINFITNIAMNLMLRYVFQHNYLLRLALLEVIIFVVEAVAYYIVLKKYKQACVLSLACNSASLTVGLALNWIFSRNFIYMGFWWLITAVVGLVGGWFNHPDVGSITNIEIYTLDYVAIDGGYYQDFMIEDYFREPADISNHNAQLNSPAPSRLFYTVEADDLDSFIVRLTLNIEDDQYFFGTLWIGGVKYEPEDLYAIHTGDEYTYIDILYNEVNEPEEGYLFYSHIYVDLITVESGEERIRLELIEMQQTTGFCFFFGELDDLMINKNENI